MATIHSIVYQPLGQDYDGRFGDFIRVPAQSARLVAGHGIEGDQKAGHARSRQLNIIPTDWLAVRKAEGYRTGPGEMGEQLIIDGLAFTDMSTGMRLQLGDQAVIELASPRTGCERLDAAQPRPIPAAIKQAGVGFMARVVTSGEIRVGDPIVVLETAVES
jgi:MOSC domain-containing protein YiiM